MGPSNFLLTQTPVKSLYFFLIFKKFISILIDLEFEVFYNNYPLGSLFLNFSFKYFYLATVINYK